MTALGAENLRVICARILNVATKKIDLEKSFLRLGGDSMAAIELLSAFRDHGCDVSIQQILEADSLSQLLDVVVGATTANIIDENVPFALSPAQALLMRTIENEIETKGGKEQATQNKYHQGRRLELVTDVPHEAIEAALGAVVSRHAMLRARFVRSESQQWLQTISPYNPESYMFRVERAPGTAEYESIITSLHDSIDYTDGPVFGAIFFETTPDGRRVLYLAAPSLIIDAASWAILIADLEQILERKALTLQPAASFQVWSDEQEAVNNMAWQSCEPAVEFGHIDETLESNTAGLLNDSFCRATHHVDAVDILLGALIASFKAVFADKNILAISHNLPSEDQRKGDFRFARTLGNFTRLRCLRVDVEDIDEPLTEVATRVAASRNSTSNTELEATDSLGSAVHFHYDGPTQESYASTTFRETWVDDSNKMKETSSHPTTPIDIHASFIQGSLRLRLNYDIRTAKREDLQRWLARAVTMLRSVLSSEAHEDPRANLTRALPTSTDRRDLLLQTVASLPVSMRDAVVDAYPCSPMQEAMMFSQIRNPGLYRCSYSFEMLSTALGTGHHVDAARIHTAWNQVVDRHSALRTVLMNSTTRSGHFDQVVFSSLRDNVIHSQSDKTQTPFGTLSELIRSFQVPYRFTISTTDSGAITCTLDVSHAIIDGESLPALARDLCLAYQGSLPFQPAPHFGDYIVYLHSIDHSVARSYWEQYLADIEPCYFPPADGDRTERRLQQERTNIPLDATHVQALCERYKVTFATICQAAWALVLKYFTGSQDVCFFVSTAGRQGVLDNIKEAVGPLLNTLICRQRLDGDNVTLGDMVKDLQQGRLKALEHEYFPLRETEGSKQSAGQALCNTIVSYQRKPDLDTSLISELRVRLQQGYNPTEVCRAHQPLNLLIHSQFNMLT
jgi:aryl carrier-like protein